MLQALARQLSSGPAGAAFAQAAQRIASASYATGSGAPSSAVDAASSSAAATPEPSSSSSSGSSRAASSAAGDGGATSAPASPAEGGPLARPGADQPAIQLLRPTRPRPVPLLEALRRVQAAARSPSFESVELHVRLRVDPRRGDQMVRGSAVLPYSAGKPVRICVFAEGEAAEEARAAGADLVGDAALVADILASKGKALEFDRCLAHPDMMKHLVALGKILGPKGLMPNPKVGTLTTDLAGAVAATRRGRLEFKMDRTAIVHAAVGNASQELGQLHANVAALMAALMAVKPEAIKGGLLKYVRKVDVASTQGRGGVEVTLASLEDALAEAGAGGQAEGAASAEAGRGTRVRAAAAAGA